MSTCCSVNCPKYNNCAKASINVEGIHTSTDKANMSFVKSTPDGKYEQQYWCGEKGGFRLFEQVEHKKIRFILNGCDISFVAEAPEDITLKELLKQTDRIEPNWCACGLRSLSEDEQMVETEIYIDRNSIRLADDTVCAKIHEDGSWINR